MIKEDETDEDPQSFLQKSSSNLRNSKLTEEKRKQVSNILKEPTGNMRY